MFCLFLLGGMVLKKGGDKNTTTFSLSTLNFFIPPSPSVLVCMCRNK